MRTFKHIKGMAVYEQHTAAMLGRVIDFCISSDGSVLGLLMNSKGLFKPHRLIPAGAITGSGEDCIVIVSEDELLPAPHSQGIYYFESHHSLQNKYVLSTEGEHLGMLENVYFSDHLARIEAYELTNGFFADLSEGKILLNAQEQTLSVSRDAIMIANDFEP
ncbi:photosystem reaction center subunit H [Bacillus lacus]|uniref:Photosystem reaction center subunit H n=1 Tax=Metabacillus lacus TaxID=1983721 RepID=A0A7X2IX29_9BACI|nr:PRC-barrel domain-containing protein [Metabacillus lacus]MRX71370.1 photosystem reaction center subunit H [Metabacillus lacus]